MRTWGSAVPLGRLTFYSDQPETDSRLPVVTLSNVTGYEDAQDRFTYLIMPHAVERMEELGCTWLAWLDDDTWLFPDNLHHLLRRYDPTSWVWLGQRCENAIPSSFCGGAGFAMSYPLAKAAACVAPACTLHAEREKAYDRRLGVCLNHTLRVKITDTPEFNSQPPWFYMTADGRKDRPHGFGRATTFHYVKTPVRPITPEEHYTALWSLFNV